MATMGTRLFTALKGVQVGEDEFGNCYYTERNGDRRWVIYKEDDEASRVPADWHAWLHKTVDETPKEAPMEAQPWEKPHEPNHTGSDLAYRPPGHITKGGQRDAATGDYEAWVPE